MSDLLLSLNSGHNGRQTTSWSLQSIFLQQKSQLLYIADYQISGLLKLWSIILEAKDQAVADMSMVYLAVLYTYRKYDTTYNDQTKVINKKVCEEVTFIQKCMTELNSGNHNDGDLLKKERVLKLIRLFVEHALRPPFIKSCLHSLKTSHGSSTLDLAPFQTEHDNINQFYIYIQLLDGPRISISCPFHEKTYFGYVREQLFQHMSQNKINVSEAISSITHNKNSADFRFIFNGAELKNSDPLVDLKISRGDTVFCCPRLSTQNVKKNAVHLVESIVDKDELMKESQTVSHNDISKISITHATSENKTKEHVSVLNILSEDSALLGIAGLVSPESM